jgi:membrane-associated phospholipid phosphatase
VNALPGAFHGPVWVVMQLGGLGGVAAVSGAAVARGHRRLAVRLAVAGVGTWLAAKVVKHPVRRGRPAVALGRARVLGRKQRGLGYPSGHAAVAASLYTVAAAELSPAARRRALGVVGAVGLARLYVGAHLPLDVIGGFGLGAAAGSAVRLAAGGAQPRSGPSASRSSWRS